LSIPEPRPVGRSLRAIAYPGLPACEPVHFIIAFGETDIL
jgi:hypothetical protein